MPVESGTVDLAVPFGVIAHAVGFIQNNHQRQEECEELLADGPWDAEVKDVDVA